MDRERIGWDKQDEKYLADFETEVQAFLKGIGKFDPSDTKWVDVLKIESHNEPLGKIERDFTGTPRENFIEHLKESLNLGTSPTTRVIEELDFRKTRTTTITTYAANCHGIYFEEIQTTFSNPDSMPHTGHIETQLVRRAD